MPDFSVKCFDADKKEFVAWLKGHATPVKEISVDSNGDFWYYNISRNRISMGIKNIRTQTKINYYK